MHNICPHARKHAILVEFVKPFRHEGHIHRAPTLVLSSEAPFNMVVGAVLLLLLLDDDDDEVDELEDVDDARLAGDAAGVGPRFRSVDDDEAAAVAADVERCSGWVVSPAIVKITGRNCFNLLICTHHYHNYINEQ
jgi:hypothetical protein